MHDADRIKLQIEAAWRAQLGSDAFDQLEALLRQVVGR